MKVTALAIVGVLALGLTVVAGGGSTGSAELEAVLLEAGDSGALPERLLGGLYGFPDPAIRAAAVQVLAVASNPDALPILARFLGDPDPRIRARVMLAAGRSGPWAEGLVRRGLGDSSPLVRQAAVWAAARLGSPLAGPLVGALGKENHAAVLETGLGNLWRLPAGSWEALAERHARDRDPLLRRAAAYALGRSPAPRVRPALRRLAGDREPVIRVLAVRGLARGTAVDLDPPVVAAALADGDWRVRAAACRVLAAHPGMKITAGAVATLESALDAGFSHLVVAAVRAAAAHPEVAVGEALRSLSAGPDPWTASEALAARVRRGEPQAGGEVAAWLGSADGWRRRAAARAAAHLEGKPAVASREAVLAGDDPSVVLAWLEGAAAAERPLSPDLLRGLLDRKDVAVRAQALDMLGEAGGAPGQAWLLDMAAGWSDDKLGDARAVAYRLALEGAKDEAARRKVLEAALAVPDWSVTAQVVAAARHMGIKAKLPPREARHGHKWYADLVRWRRQEHWLDLVTVRGTIRLRLDAATAPVTSREIWELAEAGFYDGLTVHRVVPNFVVQGGDPRGDGWGGPGFVLPDEPSLVPFDSWRVGIATSGANTGGCQLFVTLIPADHLTGLYTNFAEVVRGREVLERLEVGDVIRKVIPASGAEPPPPTPVLLGKVTWEELEKLPGWREEYRGYQPAAEVVRQLRSLRGRYRIVTVLGSWCSDSRREVPRLERVLESVGSERLVLDMFGVDRTLVVSSDGFPEEVLPGRKAERVPTIVVLDEYGQEAGRVVETAEAPLEQLLLEFLAPLEDAL